ncbi:ABC transporter substrate-binding protein [Iamia majanohamensis]|uniref:ABC transporter substrate-binding protein n=1 Tax=Iamia majanohamensis TaxID=467976 RepID=A0AAE9Y7N1_9ACTN|nr:ABC transporter substrate-binding protein [Iamia majanohamensis]WCO68254.1 ABC transporter substrate-binding protein [Iamia majanohamensis]
MTRRGRAAVVAATLLLTLVACGGGGPQATEAAPGPGERAEDRSVEAVVAEATPQLPTEVTSADGRTVRVDDVSRIVSLWGNITETVYGLGLGDAVVGRDVASTFTEAEEVPVVTRGHDVSAESVLSLRPTVVLVDPTIGPPEAIDQIRNAGVPVVVVDEVTTLDGIGGRIRQIAEALGVVEAGEALADEADAEIAAVQADIPAEADTPRVAFLYMRGSAGVYLIAGPGSGADSMIEAAGGEDAGTAIGLDRPFTPITSEALTEAAPDVILMTTTGLESVGGLDGLLEIPGIAQTPAGRDRRVVTVEDGLLYSFGGRTARALELIIDQLHTPS